MKAKKRSGWTVPFDHLRIIDQNHLSQFFHPGKDIFQSFAFKVFGHFQLAHTLYKLSPLSRCAVGTDKIIHIERLVQRSNLSGGFIIANNFSPNARDLANQTDTLELIERAEILYHT